MFANLETPYLVNGRFSASADFNLEKSMPILGARVWECEVRVTIRTSEPGSLAVLRSSGSNSFVRKA